MIESRETREAKAASDTADTAYDQHRVNCRQCIHARVARHLHMQCPDGQRLRMAAADARATLIGAMEADAKPMPGQSDLWEGCDL